MAVIGGLAAIAIVLPGTRDTRATVVATLPPETPGPSAGTAREPETDTAWHQTRPNVVLAGPARLGTVRAGELAVAGTLGRPADTVIVSIRTRREHLIDQDRVITSLDGLRFEASLDVPGPGPGQGPRRVWLEVIGYTFDGVPVAGTVTVLRVQAPAPPRLLGEDRLGTLGVDLPEASPESPPAPARTPQPAQAWPVGRLSWQVNPAQL